MRRSLIASLCLLAAGLAGCTICASPYDSHYGFYGGSWQRYEPTQGRVGSAFNNAGAPINPAPESIQPTGEPTPSGSPTRPEIPIPLRPGVDQEAVFSPEGTSVSSRRGGMPASDPN